MENTTVDNAKMKLIKAKQNLEVYSDLYFHFECVFEADYYSEGYKDTARSLLNAILTKIDPIDY